MNETLSDLAGMDARLHHGDPNHLIISVGNWLKVASGRGEVPKATSIAKRYADFTAQLPDLKKPLNDLPFLDLTNITMEWLRAYPDDPQKFPL